MSRTPIFLVILGCCLAGPGCETADQERLNQLNTDGMHRFTQGDFHGACESFEGALALKPDDANLLYNVGQCFDRQGDAAQAETWYRRCLERSDEHADCQYALAVLLCRTGRRPAAETLIRDWLTRSPNLADPYALDGWLLRQDKAYPQAQQQLHRALNIDPHCTRALVELGILYEDINLPERSRVLYERALAKNPNQPEVTERLNQLVQKNVGRPKPTREPGIRGLDTGLNR